MMTSAMELSSLSITNPLTASARGGEATRVRRARKRATEGWRRRPQIVAGDDEALAGAEAGDGACRSEEPEGEG